MTTGISRRGLLLGGIAGSTATLVRGATPSTEPGGPAFRCCLNTSTIRGQKLGIVKEIELASKVGFDAVEPWLNQLQDYVQAGNSLADLRKRLSDLGLKVPSAIGFAPWIVDDDAARAKGLESAKRDMALVAAIGGERLAAPPVGATDKPDLNLCKAAERYRALCDLGDQFGVVPQVEVWGFSKSLQRLGEAVLVAMESGHPKACVLPDIYHLYKGGSDFQGLTLLRGSSIGIFHINDYPAELPRDRIKDADRVYPGDGVAPIPKVLKSLREQGYSGYLSLELFNPTYWQQDAEQVLRTGLAKMKEVIAAAAK